MATTHIYLITYNLKTKAGWKYFLRALWQNTFHSIKRYGWTFSQTWRDTFPSKGYFTYKKTKVWKGK